MSYLIIGDQSGIGKKLANTLLAMDKKVYGRTKDGRYYKHILDKDPNDFRISEDYGYEVSSSDKATCVGEFIDIKSITDLDTVVDCGGINKQSWIKDDPNAELFTEVMNNNAKKFYTIYHDTIDTLRNNEGIYITIASVTARRDMSCSSQYCASKAAMVSLSRNAAREEDRIRGPWYENNNKYCSFFTVSPIWIPETGMGHYLIGQYMNKRNVTDRNKAEKDFCSELYQKKNLELDAVNKFLLHLILENRSLSRSLMGSDVQIGNQP